MPYVYKIRNKLNNKCYIGYTSRCDVEHRIREHFSPSVYENNKKPLYNSIKKYGKENFDFKVLYESLNVIETLNMEKKFISEMGDYNIHPGGNVPPCQKGKTWKHSEESKMLMRKPKPPRTQQHAKNLSESLKGNIPWNKGKKGVQVSWNKGTRDSPMTSKWKITKQNEEFIIENLVLWCDENNYNKNTVKYHFYKNLWPYKDIEKIEKLKCKELE